MKKKLCLLLALMMIFAVVLSACGMKSGAPTGLEIKNGSLTWNKVDKAEKYTVSVNGAEQSVTTNNFSLAALTDDIDYVLKVRAVAKKDKLSDWSATITYHPTVTPPGDDFQIQGSVVKGLIGIINEIAAVGDDGKYAFEFAANIGLNLNVDNTINLDITADLVLSGKLDFANYLNSEASVIINIDLPSMVRGILSEQAGVVVPEKVEVYLKNGVVYVGMTYGKDVDTLQTSISSAITELQQYATGNPVKMLLDTEFPEGLTYDSLQAKVAELMEEYLSDYIDEDAELGDSWWSYVLAAPEMSMEDVWDLIAENVPDANALFMAEVLFNALQVENMFTLTGKSGVITAGFDIEPLKTYILAQLKDHKFAEVVLTDADLANGLYGIDWYDIQGVAQFLYDNYKDECTEIMNDLEYTVGTVSASKLADYLEYSYWSCSNLLENDEFFNWVIGSKYYSTLFGGTSNTPSDSDLGSAVYFNYNFAYDVAEYLYFEQTAACMGFFQRNGLSPVTSVHEMATLFWNDSSVANALFTDSVMGPIVKASPVYGRLRAYTNGVTISSMADALAYAAYNDLLDFCTDAVEHISFDYSAEDLKGWLYNDYDLCSALMHDEVVGAALKAEDAIFDLILEAAYGQMMDWEYTSDMIQMVLGMFDKFTVMQTLDVSNERINGAGTKIDVGVKLPPEIMNMIEVFGKSYTKDVPVTLTFESGWTYKQLADFTVTVPAALLSAPVVK